MSLPHFANQEKIRLLHMKRLLAVLIIPLPLPQNILRSIERARKENGAALLKS